MRNIQYPVSNIVFILIFLLTFFFYFSPILLNLDSKTLGPFGDKMGLILPLETGRPIFSNQPVLAVAATSFSKFFSPFAVYNLLVLLSFPLTAFFAYRFFKRFFDSWLSFSLALVFTFSPYHILKIHNHIDLSQIWVFPLCFSALWDFDKDKSLKTTLRLSGLLALTTLVSNYYGYFMLIIVGIFFLIRILQYLVSNIRSPISNIRSPISNIQYLILDIKYWIFVILFYLLLITPFLLPYFRANYFGSGGSLEVKRGISDFATFTARPWYFVTPSVYHPVFGKLAEGVHKWFENTGYFLCDDFFAEEHSGIFLGWTNLVLAAYAVGRAQPVGLKPRNPTGFSRRSVISIFLWLMLALMILSGPPFFTISGFKIYLPSYLLMKGFPMFRTLARLGVPILLCLLVLVGFTLESIRKKFSRFPNIQYLIFGIYLLIALFEFYNPPTIVKVPKRGSVEYNKLIRITEIGK